MATSFSLISVSWWIGGALGPDAGIKACRTFTGIGYRASESGTKSFPSPATRSAVSSREGSAFNSSPPPPPTRRLTRSTGIRFGGSLLEWRYIGTGPNAATQFNDDFPDDRIATNPLLDFGVQPFLTLGLPITGTV